MRFKKGDRCTFIEKGKFYGIQGTVIEVSDDNRYIYTVTYDCSKTNKIFGGHYSDIEDDSTIRHLTKLEKALK